MLKYTIIVEKARGNYSAYCPDLPGCIATGSTAEETIERMREAIRFHIEGLKRENIAIPEPSSQATYIEVAA
ncbi:unnamed protein product [marine sediment metagenome]|uniref:HicB-like antitoxin of toxin-antitoxin system domain-containing protein n=1 Tax=marine sediment metagenome TaxID=412755 RepID=X1P4W8_9ZZZZ